MRTAATTTQRRASTSRLRTAASSIIDLTAAADQPFTKHGLTLSYNGELYNFRELRRELASTGARFSTSSDTEVVLEAWHRWGPACLDRFRGMFAFSLFDERTGRLVLARDQLGIKPLYYLHRDGALVFASELKAVTRVLGPELAHRRRGRRRVDAVLLGARPALCDRGSREAPAGDVGRDPPRRIIGRAPVLGHRRGRGGRRGRIRLRISARRWRTRSPRISCPTCPCRRSSAGGSTRAS